MTAYAGIAYLLITFSPALAIFRNVISSDPLRIILFVLGAFFWLLSLLLSALVWYAVVPLRDYLVFSVCVSIVLQETARLLYFVLLKYAQKGLQVMANEGMHISGVETLHQARHLLATVCGLGMGVMSASFLVINVIADFWGDGTVGLPASIPEFRDRFVVKLLIDDELFPLMYSISASLLIILHVCWTVLFWDGCHKKGKSPIWWTSILFAVASHCAVSAMSFWNRDGFSTQMVVLGGQSAILLLNAIYCCVVIGVTWQMVKQMPGMVAKNLWELATCQTGCCNGNGTANPSNNRTNSGNNRNNAHQALNSDMGEPRTVNT